MTRRDGRRRVGVFDASLPPALAVIRSLGRRGIPVAAYDMRRHASGRYSRFASSFARCPDTARTDEFVAWLDDEARRGRFELVAPTSDYTVFAVAEVDERRGTDLAGGVGGVRGADAVRDCLFKDRFARRMTKIGFPVLPWAAPTTVDEAVAGAAAIGYPVVLKPRSHVGIGIARGTVVHDEDDLRRAFTPFPLDAAQSLARTCAPDLAHPLLQHFLVGDTLECVSITGCFDRAGDLLAAGCSRNVARWGDGLAIGTLFEVPPRPAFFDEALEAVREVLGCGIFELEVLFDRTTGEYYAIDLNPRGFGQIALDIGRGADLPHLWYESARRAPSVVPAAPSRRVPIQWRMGVPFFAGAAVRLIRGPSRRTYARQLRRLLRPAHVAAMHAWTDPLPGLAFAGWILRHPRALVQPFLDADRPPRPVVEPQEASLMARLARPDRTVASSNGAKPDPDGTSPLVSVVIPTFRREQGLRAAIDSVLDEGVDSFEILVLDDAPERSARAAVAAVGDPRVRYVANPTPSGGRPAEVRNLGIRIATGRYLYFLDDDDRVVPGGLSAMLAALDAHPDRGVAFGTVRCVGPDDHVQARYERWFDWAARQAQRFRHTSLLTVGMIMFRGTVIINSCCVIRADHARLLGGYDSGIPVYEDVEFFTRGIRAFGHIFVDTPVLSYTTGEPSIINDLDGDWGPVQNSYAIMHRKYRQAHGHVDYRVLQIVSKLLPVGEPS